MNIGLIAKLLGGAVGAIGGALRDVISLGGQAVGIAKKLLDITLQFDDAGIQMGRHMGTSYNTSLGLTKALISDTKDLAGKYGVTTDVIAKLQESIVSATGKAVILNKTQREGLLQTAKFMDGATQSTFVNSLDKMGSNLATARNSMMGAIKAASSMGLSTTEATAKIAKNLEKANSYSFKNGIDGITKMTLLGEKLRVDMGQMLSGAVPQFQEISNSIENAARLQNLGGSYAANGANPMTMLYEANNDPEALAERITKMFSGKGTFDQKTGEVKMSGLQMQMMGAAAGAMGISKEEAIAMNKNSIKNKVIEEQMGSAANKLTENEKAYVQNQAQYNTDSGKFEMTYVDKGGNRQTVDVDKLDANTLKEIQAQNALTTEQAIIQASQQQVTVMERMAAVQDMIGAFLADFIVPYMPIIHEFLAMIPDLLIEAFGWIHEKMDNLSDPGWWMGLIGKTVGGALSWLWGMVKGFFIGIWDNLGSFFSNFFPGMLGVLKGSGKWVMGKLGNLLGNIPLLKGLKNNWEKEGTDDIKSFGAQSWKGLKAGASAALDISMFIPGAGQLIGAASKLTKVAGLVVKGATSLTKVAGATSKAAKLWNGATSIVRFGGRATNWVAKGASASLKPFEMIGRNMGTVRRIAGGGNQLTGYARLAGGRLMLEETNRNEVSNAVSNGYGAIKETLPTLGRMQELAEKAKDVHNSINTNNFNEAYSRYTSNREANQTKGDATNTSIINSTNQSTANGVVNNETTSGSATNYSTNINKSYMSTTNNSNQSTSNGVVNNSNNIASTSTSNSTNQNTANGVVNNETTSGSATSSIDATNEKTTEFSSFLPLFEKANASIDNVSVVIERVGKNIVQAVVNPDSPVIAKEYDGKIDIFKPDSDSKQNKPIDVKVNDININLSGSITLNGGNGKNWNVNANELLSDFNFRKALIDTITREISTNVSGKNLSQDVTGRRNTWSRMIFG